MTNTTNHLMAVMICLFMAFGCDSSWAAKAPLSVRELKDESTHIVSGRVLEVDSMVQKSEVETAAGVHRDFVFSIVLRVEAVSKGDNVKVGDEIEVKAWKVASRLPPLTGLQGHDPIPKVGDVVTVYVAGTKGEIYEPILPNGIVIDQAADVDDADAPGAKVGIVDRAIASLLFAADSDEFAENLAIPSDIEVAEPLELNGPFGNARDTFQQDLLTALESPGTNDTTVTANTTTLSKLQQTSPEVLMRFLATSPEWRVFKKRGKVLATRRWVICSEWQYESNGYYSRFDLRAASDANIPDFQTQFTIAFSQGSWPGLFRSGNTMKAGHSGALQVSTRNQLHESRCIIQEDGLVIEVFEQSPAKERRLTKAALSHIEQEFAPLAVKPNWATIRNSLPAESIREGQPTFNLRNTSNPGIYNSDIWVNPGEPGMLYLKAFEITKGTPLSVSRLAERSNEWVGWSTNPKELFFANSNFTIYEGDWGEPYAARFEVWFTPDSGGEDRKLLEKNFKIEGWER